MATQINRIASIAKEINSETMLQVGNIEKEIELITDISEKSAATQILLMIKLQLVQADGILGILKQVNI